MQEAKTHHSDKYKEYTARLKALIHTKFKAYVTSCTDSLSTNPNKFWVLVGGKMGSRGYPDIMKLDMEKAKANLFNQFFTSILLNLNK